MLLLQVRELQVVLGGATAVGFGDVVVDGTMAQRAAVIHMGRGDVAVVAHTADVQLEGTGDVYVDTGESCVCCVWVGGCVVGPRAAVGVSGACGG
jgi:hypothetical protein